VILKKSTDFMDKSKSGKDRFNAKMSAGEYTAILEPNPSGNKNDSDWLIFEGTTIGGTFQYIKSIASSIQQI
jgi:hypothetical protein